ncbi:acyl-CoA thioesterase [Kiritimatiellaeota bacterium B1221]|nr:acyl-CoA thioesterase [Kiritimatiellaeota bacterium B1221]
MTDEPFKITLEVRDYECDLQGIVNNSVYQNYLEHARHKFLQAKNVDFAKLTAEGIHLVVIKAELEYKKSLKPNETFTVSVELEKVGRVRWAFLQEVRRQPDNELMLKGRISGVGLNQNGRPHVVPELEPLMNDA